jgi:hypothetical protein
VERGEESVKVSMLVGPRKWDDGSSMNATFEQGLGTHVEPWVNDSVVRRNSGDLEGREKGRVIDV